MTTATTTLAEFLLARIAEAEADARREGPMYLKAAYDGAPEVPANCAARVLADCEAKRRIVALHWGKPPWRGTFAECQECGHRSPCQTLRALALPYANHPDYREEWRP